MDKKFYEMPALEVINLHIEAAILAGSDTLDPDVPKTDPTPIEDPELFG